MAQAEQHTKDCWDEGFEEFPYVVGFNVERFRTREKLTKERFAQMIGCGRPMLDRIEDGEADLRLSMIRKLGVALGVSYEELTTMPEQYEKVDVKQVLIRRKAERNEKNAAKSPANRKKKAEKKPAEQTADTPSNPAE